MSGYSEFLWDYSRVLRLGWHFNLKMNQNQNIKKFQEYKTKVRNSMYW